MNRGQIKIIIEDGKAPRIEAQLINNTLWMSKSEMLQFFQCFGQKIEMNLRSIFKNGLLKEKEVSYTYRYADKGIEKQSVFYSLEVLIFLSYRIGTFEAKIFRQFINSALREHLQRKEVEKITNLFWYYRENLNYWMN